MKIKVAVLIWFAVCVNSVFAQNAHTINWWHTEENAHSVQFDMYYFEDHSGYLGTINISCLYGTEIVDIPVDGYRDLSYDEIGASMEMMLQNVEYLWAGENELAWGNGLPQQLQLTPIPQQPTCHSNYLPLIVN